MEEAIRKADILIEALPYIKEFRGKIFVVKYGGSILCEEKIRQSVLEDIVFLGFMGIRIVLVHGGGITITERMREKKLEPHFYEGIRVTDKDTLRVVDEELSELRTQVFSELKALGARVFALNGKEELFYVKKKQASIDLGFVGEMDGINKDKFHQLLNEYGVVIVSPMGVDRKGIVYNINADEAAAFAGGKLDAEKAVFLTNVKGIMKNPDDPGSLISSVNEEQIQNMVQSGVINEGMLPKVRSGLFALAHGTKKVHIIDAKIPHALLLEIFTKEGIGTEIVP